ncbi:MAG: acetyl-CoA hydrolase/transferase C-terminal domain-containing protein [Dehalococcoidales bacterium]|nr:acetyl-CoA hydrolase/transferase C-terminal domain-containing protein [Dehalococcoidales bacterium]
MNWKEIYRKKLTTAEQAVKAIKSGNRVVFSHCCGEPQHLVRAMVANKEAYRNVEIVHMVPMGLGEYCRPENAKHFIHNSLFVGASTREAVNSGRAKYTPCFFHEIPRLFTDKILPVDVLLCSVSPPDEQGNCSFGVSVDYTKIAAESARIVIAQVNDQMPRTLGDAFINVSKLDYIVEFNEPLPEAQPPAITETEMAIGNNCAQLIDDGACLQLGIGAIPDAVLRFLGDKKDLGIHSEMFSDGAVELMKMGVINCSKKNLHPGKTVATFLMGTKKLYDFVNNNPFIEMHTVNYTNNPCIIGQNDNMVAINSCLQVDLLGQVASDTIGLTQFSAVGGQVDFVRGASMSKNGKSIMAFPSTASGGKYSRIVPRLAEGSAVTTSRNDVHYLVTEYGIANLRGKSVRERAKALINIAHPAFRGNLEREMAKMTVL